MTAFARSEVSVEDIYVSLELRGYNSRNLDLAIKIPQIYSTVEDKLRRALTDRIARGRIEIKVSIENNSEFAETFSVNESLAQAYHTALIRLKSALKLASEIPLEVVAKKNGVIESTENEINTEEIWTVVNTCLEKVLAEFDAMKSAEGQSLETDLLSRLAFIEDCINRIDDQASGMLGYYQEKLRDRINVLTSGLVELDPARIAQEAALLADRSDISEEIVRARSHLAQFRQIMKAPSPSGRPLNFLLQEFNREFNTMGSKAGKALISHLVVSAKTELEKLREQIQNVE
ncbi:MAG: YicC family protein [Desulfobacterales bacterium]|nr:YicC family protein [Desulfobacterales bacterium]